MATLQLGSNLFDPTLVTEIFNKVKGASALAKLSNSEPISFTGNKLFTFNMDNEVDAMGEGDQSKHGGVSLQAKTITPVRVEYGARVSVEFMHASEAQRVDILKAYNDGFARKLARGFDIMALHGKNPRTMEASPQVNNNHFAHEVTQVAETPAGLASMSDALSSAAALVQGSENEINGIILAPSAAAVLSKARVNGVREFPELGFGGIGTNLQGLPLEVSGNLSKGSDNKCRALVGDFAGAFKWGFASGVEFSVIPYGDPDKSGRDLAGCNEIYLKSAAWLGWCILDPSAFAFVKEQG